MQVQQLQAQLGQAQQDLRAYELMQRAQVELAIHAAQLPPDAIQQVGWQGADSTV
jgi:hypothetical protein